MLDRRNTANALAAIDTYILRVKGDDNEEATAEGLRIRRDLWSRGGHDESAERTHNGLIEEYESLYGTVSAEKDEELKNVIIDELKVAEAADARKSAELIALDEALSKLNSGRRR